jgi:hypothetical protein
MVLIQGRSRERHRHLDLLLMLVPALAGAVACLIDLNGRSLWLDEGSTFAIASQGGSVLWHGISHDGGNMLAYYVLMHVVIGLFGDAAWVMRMPSVLALAATGALMVAIALRLFDDARTAIAAGLLTVISLPLVFWGQDARGYALLVAFTCASFLALIAILQTPLRYAPSRAATTAYVATLVIALYLGYDVVLVIPAQLALLLVFRERARVVTGCLLLVALLCVPLLVLALERGSGQLFFVTPLSFRVLGQAAVTLLSAGLPPNFHDTFTTVATVVVMALAALVAIVWVGRAALSDARPTHSWPLLLPLGWLLLTSVIAVLLLAIGEPIELERVTVLVIPALALLLAWTFSDPALPPYASSFLLALLIVLRLAQVIPAYGVSPEDWKGARAYVASHTSPARPACVVFYPQDGRESFDYYLLRAHSGGGDPAADLRPVLPVTPWATVRPFVEDYASLGSSQLAGIVSECPRLWLIASHEGQRNGTAQSRANLARFEELRGALTSAYPNSSLTVFGWASRVKVLLLSR